jgi:hypothetical protein
MTASLCVQMPSAAVISSRAYSSMGAPSRACKYFRPTAPTDGSKLFPADMLQLPNLFSLILSSSSKVSSAFWQQLPRLARFTQLSISVCHITTIKDDTSAMHRLQRLKALSLAAHHVVISSREPLC